MFTSPPKQQQPHCGVHLRDLTHLLALHSSAPHSLVGETPLHGAQNLLLHTGRSLGTAPSMGSWIAHGLGTENENLPGYVLLNNDWIPNGGLQNFTSGFLPATCEATLVRAEGTPVDNIAPADPPAVQRAKLGFLRDMRDAAADGAARRQTWPSISRF
jgi:hypothetical protein